MRSFPIQLSACAIAAAALLSACGGGGTTPGTVNTAAVSGSTGACTAAPCINFAETNLGMVDFGGLGIEVANDPADATNKVAKLTKATADEPWAGVTVHLGGTGNTVTRIDPALGITLRVYSPAVGKTIMVKIEDAAANGVEATATSTKAGEWETLTFTYPSPNAGTIAAAVIRYTTDGSAPSSTSPVLVVVRSAPLPSGGAVSSIPGGAGRVQVGASGKLRFAVFVSANVHGPDGYWLKISRL